ncbi:MAG: hypothetical protein HXM53_06200 [Megasphaera micronuciformis]|nr:hypothetical protein [Megasphaera micronuciformis]
MYQVIEKRGEKENIIRKTMKSLSDCHEVIKMRLNYLHRFNNYDHTFYIMEEGRVIYSHQDKEAKLPLGSPVELTFVKGRDGKRMVTQKRYYDDEGEIRLSSVMPDVDPNEYAIEFFLVFERLFNHNGKLYILEGSDPKISGNYELLSRFIEEYKI